MLGQRSSGQSLFCSLCHAVDHTCAHLLGAPTVRMIKLLIMWTCWLFNGACMHLCLYVCTLYYYSMLLWKSVSNFTCCWVRAAGSRSDLLYSYWISNNRAQIRFWNSKLSTAQTVRSCSSSEWHVTKFWAWVSHSINVVGDFLFCGHVTKELLFLTFLPPSFAVKLFFTVVVSPPSSSQACLERPLPFCNPGLCRISNWTASAHLVRRLLAFFILWRYLRVRWSVKYRPRRYTSISALGHWHILLQLWSIFALSVATSLNSMPLDAPDCFHLFGWVLPQYLFQMHLSGIGMAWVSGGLV